MIDEETIHQRGATADMVEELWHAYDITQMVNRKLWEHVDELQRKLQDSIELPKDADGEYIHFGDVLDQFGTPMTVYAMTDPKEEGDCMLELISGEVGEDRLWVRARKMRHYHNPAVADVLRNVVTLCHSIWHERDECWDVDSVMESGNMRSFIEDIEKLKEDQ